MLVSKLSTIYSPTYLKYDFGPEHPFWPERAKVFLEKLGESAIPHRILEPQEAEDRDISLVHTKDYLERVKRLAREFGALSIDTPLNPDVLEAAYFSVGGSILALREALKGKKVMNLLGGLHHAGISNSSGFCIFNDHSIAVRKLQKEKKIKKVIIYDLDVHAGQGTQEIFYSDSSVFTVSIHQDPHTLYPGTGFGWQRGEGAGVGYNLNIPLPPDTREGEYLEALDFAFGATRGFSPDVTVLVLGVDTFKEDPLAAIMLEEDSYRKIGKRFKAFPRLAIMCAGGYSEKTPDLWLKFLGGYLSSEDPPKT